MLNGCWCRSGSKKPFSGRAPPCRQGSADIYIVIYTYILFSPKPVSGPRGSLLTFFDILDPKPCKELHIKLSRWMPGIDIWKTRRTRLNIDEKTRRLTRGTFWFLQVLWTNHALCSYVLKCCPSTLKIKSS